MTYHSAWGAGSSAAPYHGAGGEWASRARYTPADFITLLWRDRWLMLGVFLAIFLVGAGAAFTMKTQYPAHSSILIRLGPEYVYEPSIGDAARGAIPTNDQLIQSEVEILQSDALRRQVLDSLGYGRVFPDQAEAFARSDPAKRRQMTDEAVASMGQALKVESAPDTSVVRVTYSDDDAQRAAMVLNRFLDQYLIYRRQVLVEGSEPIVDQQLKLFQERLNDADAAYQAFLTGNNIDDFDAEKSSLNGLQTSLTDENYRVGARLKEIAGRLGEIGKQVGTISPEIDLYRDSNPATTDKLLQLQIDRQDLLSRYKPDSQPVKDIDQRIAQMKSMASSTAGQSKGAVRSGVNPIYQSVQTEQLQLNAEAASLHERQAALTEQLGQISERRQQLNELEPQYLTLTQNRDLLQAQVKDLTQKGQSAQAAQAIGQRSNDNIRIVERPSVPTKGKSLKKPLFVLAFLFAGFTAGCIGLVRVFLLRGFPTPGSAARTLDLPVLAAASYKRNV